SVREMIDRVTALTGHGLAPVVTGRRPGDPARVVASADRAAARLGWKARLGVDDMIRSAWGGWLLRHPEAARGGTGLGVPDRGGPPPAAGPGVGLRAP